MKDFETEFESLHAIPVPFQCMTDKRVICAIIDLVNRKPGVSLHAKFAFEEWLDWKGLVRSVTPSKTGDAIRQAKDVLKNLLDGVTPHLKGQPRLMSTEKMINNAQYTPSLSS